MGRPIERICVLGGGSAGYLSAVTLRRLLPGREVTLVQSPDIPVIGVGESTTAYLPVFLHNVLALDRKRFYAEVQPSWKLGNRFIWGPADARAFNYAFSFELSERAGPLRKRAAFYCLEKDGYAGPISALMDKDLSPCVFAYGGRYHLMETPHGYHPFGYQIDNKRFLAYLDGIAREFGVEFASGSVADVACDTSGDVTSLKFDDGRELTADLFIDCSGFDSLLLGKTLGEQFVSYSDNLLCDRAVVGACESVGPVQPYTIAKTMDQGWCWRIEHPDWVRLGYVHASQFCTEEEAQREMRRKHPELGEKLRVISFPSGRYENFWVQNVIAVGNASGFVEPLEATALHMIAQQIVGVCATLLDSDYRIDPPARDTENGKFRRAWDEIRDFLALHYKFNSRLNTPFWRYCRENCNLGGSAAGRNVPESGAPRGL